MSDIEELEKELSDLEQENQELQDDLSNAKDRIKELETAHGKAWELLNEIAEDCKRVLRKIG